MKLIQFSFNNSSALLWDKPADTVIYAQWFHH